MTTPFAETAPSTRGRILAVLELLVITCGITAQVFISDRLEASGDAAKTAANILANTSLYRLGYTIFMIEMVAQVVVITMYYDLMKPVNRSLARVTTVIGLTGAGIKTMSRLFFYAPLLLLGGASYLNGFEQAEIETLSLAFIRINHQGAAIALIFFGFETVLRGWMVYKSEFLPRFLGVLSMIAGLGWLTYLWPPLGAQALMFVALTALIGSFLSIGWLLVRGIDDVKWRARAALAASSIWR